MTGTLPADHAGARVRASPNFGERRGRLKPYTIILHYTGMASGEAAEDWLCNPASQVSSHYLVHENGEIVQMVSEADRAWHAGQSLWGGKSDLNSRSVGIEIANAGPHLGYPDFPATQIESLIGLCRGIVARHEIAPRNVLAHSDVAPGRKIDPGEKFPWDILGKADVGHWVAPEPPGDDPGLGEGQQGDNVTSLQSRLRLYGYGIEPSGEYDPHTRVVVEAFQRHFRPQRVDGMADRSTMLTLDRLLEALPDRPA